MENETIAQSLNRFLEYWKNLKGDEKGESQLFLDHLFRAFGHGGVHEVGATLEDRIKKKNKTNFADLHWHGRVLVEMKKRGSDLARHYDQAFDYWKHLVPNKPKYVVLCNFDEFYIYNFDVQVYDPIDTLKTKDLPSRYTSLNFLFPENKTPLFRNNLVEVTKDAACKAAKVYNSLVLRGYDKGDSQRFILQCIFCMFAEDFELLPAGLFSEIVEDSLVQSAGYGLIISLFNQMNSKKGALEGKFKNVPYFNGGLFSSIPPVNLNKEELELLKEAALEDWSKVKPEIFGTLFQSSMGADERHAYGAHFTSEADIYKIVLPTIVNPWRERIDSANTLKALLSLKSDISKYNVLDPSCGSGNFLYVAYRELKKIESLIVDKIYEKFGEKAIRKVGLSRVSTRQFWGIDNNSFAVELAKVTLLLAKEISVIDQNSHFKKHVPLPDLFEKTLPLDNVDENIVCADALFQEWPKADAIIGNPPYQSKNKMLQEYGRTYLNKLRRTYPEIPGRADYCVYWFRKAHDMLESGGRAGLVGTNTIRQNYSREGGLDYIVNDFGVITDAVGSQVWSGDAVVHVSIVNWTKGKWEQKCVLMNQIGDSIDSPWESFSMDAIPSSLTADIDTTNAASLKINNLIKKCFQGQTHGHKGFLIESVMISDFVTNGHLSDVAHPYMTASDMLTTYPPCPKRYAIDFADFDIIEASKYKKEFRIIREIVLPDIEKKATEEKVESGSDTGPRQNHLNHWWKFWRPRCDMIEAISQKDRYIVCGRVTKRPIFNFVKSSIHPNDALMVFAFDDDYSFGIIQSSCHWLWFTNRCSTLKSDFRYTSESVFSSFPWPQNVTSSNIISIADASLKLRSVRKSLMDKRKCSLRELYQVSELPGKNSLKDAHATLDRAVIEAYQFNPKRDILSQLLELNLKLAVAETSGTEVVGPGIPCSFTDTSSIIYGLLCCAKSWPRIISTYGGRIYFSDRTTCSKWYP